MKIEPRNSHLDSILDQNDWKSPIGRLEVAKRIISLDLATGVRGPLQSGSSDRTARILLVSVRSVS